MIYEVNMKHLILILLAVIPAFSRAQISLSVADFADAGDTVRLSLANPIAIDFQNTGPNAIWDFSQLSAQSQSLTEYNPIGFGSILILATFGPIASTPYKATYFNPSNDLPIDQFSAFLPIEISNLSQYTRRTSSQINSIGYSIDVQGQGVPFKSDTIETRYALPLQFNDAYNSRGYTYVDLNPATDIKFIQHRQRNSVVDGWGSLTTPLGTFDALRIKHDILETDSIYQTLFGSGAWIAPPTFSTTIYEWWTNQKNECLVRATVGGFGQNQGAPTIQYQDIYLGLDAALEENIFEVSFYPNPVTDWCYFNATAPIEFVQIFDQFGRLVFEQQNAAFIGYFDLGNLISGTYTLVVHSAKASIHRKLVKL